MKITLGDVDQVTARLGAKSYRLKVAGVRPPGGRAAFAIVAKDLDRLARNRKDLTVSGLWESRAEAWSVFAHGFSVPDYDEVPELRALVDHLLASGAAMELD